MMKDGVDFPPLLVVFDGSSYWLVDGFHRRFAAVKAKIDKLKCVVVTGTREDARWLSYGVNQDHGLRRTNEDKKKAVIAALKHPKGAKKSDRAIAEHVGVDGKTVARWREKLEVTAEIPQSDEREGADGRTIDTTNIGSTATEPEPEGEEVEEYEADEEVEYEEEDEPEEETAPPDATGPTPYDHLVAWWGKASPDAQCRFRLYIDGEFDK